MGLKCFLFCVCIKSIWCLTLDPYPTVNVIRYNSQSFNCSVDPNWSSVAYSQDDTNIALFIFTGGKCKDFADHTSRLYTTDCDDSTRTFYLTINNVTDAYNGRTIQCRVRYSTVTSSKTSLIDVQYQPTTLPTITQTPGGPIIEGNKLTLTCTIQGGNPVATITWSCDGATQTTPTGSPSTVDAISSVELVSSKDNNGQICTCTGRHILWTSNKIQQDFITVYYEPTSTPSIIQTPSGPINETSTVILTCDIKGGNPLAIITWTCEGSSPITPTGSPPNNTATASVQLTVSSNDNGRICTCIGHHPVSRPDKPTDHTLHVRYQPTTPPTITQIPVGPIIEGNTVILICTIQGGNPVATITWSCDGATQITPTGSPSTLDAISRIELVTSKNNNGQVCTCTGRHLLWTNDRIQQHTVTVYYSPTVSIKNIDPLEVVENVTLKLVCQVLDANPTVNAFSWHKGSSTTPIGLLSNFSISKVIKTYSGEFRCKGSNGIGQNGVYFNVLYSPTVSIMNMHPLDVVKNATLKLVCQVLDANPTVNSFSWYKGSSTTPIGLLSNFSISKVIRTDSGEYRCEGSNGIGQNGVDTVYVNVLYNPEITHLSVIDSNEIVENNTAILQCKVESNPLSKVEWTFENKTLNEGNHDVLQSYYTIQRAKCVDTGFYMCTATNIINMKSYSDKRVVQLSVRCSPRRDTMFELPENQIRLAPGQHLKMQIHIIAYPSPVVEWQFRPTNNFIARTLSSNCNQTSMFMHTACFEKDNVTEADFGQYSIFVYNELGNNFSYLFNVNPQDKPTAPTVFYVVCKTTSAVVLWRSEFNGGSNQEFYVQYWRISQSSSVMLSPYIPDSGVTADIQYTVNNLVPETIYMYQIIARNDLGDSLSKSVKCTTDQTQSQTKPAPICKDSNGLLAAGISSLIIGLISIIFSVSFTVICRSRLQKREQKMRSNDYTELTTCTHCNPVVTNNYDSLNTTAIEKKKLKEQEEMYDNMKI